VEAQGVPVELVTRATKKQSTNRSSSVDFLVDPRVIGCRIAAIAAASDASRFAARRSRTPRADMGRWLERYSSHRCGIAWRHPQPCSGPCMP
jgi:hypothetical protein